ncbi:TetR/AcrR family transcriptional regulator [Planomonospora venezuelensis]|uniref:TetR/AcrR family transcriptional regulator n=1 Tax=Planomonospora venezuelensis TaxID=1999 RepID=UPI0031F09C15
MWSCCGGARTKSARGPRPALSLESIARTATDIADAEGLAAISMQRVAADLGFTKMSLYRYVASKNELLAVMIDTAVGEPPDLSAVPGWRPRLEEFARQLAEVWTRHPWLPQITLGERFMGPREVGWIESAVAALHGTGLTGRERLDAVFLLFGHMRYTQSMATAGTQPWTAGEEPGSDMTELMTRYAERFPALTAAIDGARGAPHDNGRAFGLRCLLDGLGTLIEERAAH